MFGRSRRKKVPLKSKGFSGRINQTRNIQANQQGNYACQNVADLFSGAITSPTRRFSCLVAGNPTSFLRSQPVAPAAITSKTPDSAGTPQRFKLSVKPCGKSTRRCLKIGTQRRLNELELVRIRSSTGVLTQADLQAMHCSGKIVLV